MRLKLSDQAQADLKDIAEYIARKSQNRTIGRNFTKKIIAKCKELASIKGTMGIARPDLGRGLRSHPFGNYVLIFMYEDDCFYVVTIIEGHRDIQALF